MKKKHKSVVADIAKANEEKERLQSEFNVAIVDYVENELQPEEIFVQHSKQSKKAQWYRKNLTGWSKILSNEQA